MHIFFLVVFSSLHAFFCVHRRLLQAIRYTGSGDTPYYNAARDAPSLFRYEASKILIAPTATYPDKKRIACFLMPGVVESCNIKNPFSTEWQGAVSTVRQIRIFPLSQENEMTMATLGAIMKVPEFLAKVSGGTLSFSSRKQGASNGMCSSAPFSCLECWCNVSVLSSSYSRVP